MKYLLTGTILSVIGVLLSTFLWSFNQAYMIPGGIGMVFLLGAMVTSGSMVSGDRMRANFSTESADDRKIRNRTTSRLALLGLPSLFTAILIYYLF
ncbi:DUF5316 domain-containing protein [Sutcliffiella cohnii]|uniref:DUF5316 domain-containing protein n=1 Tax=Sutcliffiella cohnii TaxID=33932 RepID=UPI002E208C86|nr:DUF5316 domain-containing protein [Sutcliffiella cohnii]